MNEMAQRLFVYGTLMPGESNYGQIEDCVVVTQSGTVEGLLVDLGAFPALVPGIGIVRGVLLEINPAALKVTDRIEGYVPDRDRCLYLREEVTVFLKGGEGVTAWTYVFANPDSIADHPRLIVDVIDGKPITAWPRE